MEHVLMSFLLRNLRHILNIVLVDDLSIILASLNFYRSLYWYALRVFINCCYKIFDIFLV